jgi:hypothetical protein
VKSAVQLNRRFRSQEPSNRVSDVVQDESSSEKGRWLDVGPRLAQGSGRTPRDLL